MMLVFIQANVNYLVSALFWHFDNSFLHDVQFTTYGTLNIMYMSLSCYRNLSLACFWWACRWKVETSEEEVSHNGGCPPLTNLILMQITCS